MDETKNENIWIKITYDKSLCNYFMKAAIRQTKKYDFIKITFNNVD